MYFYNGSPRNNNPNPDYRINYRIINSFNNASTTILAHKSTLVSNFDYFASLSRYDTSLSCTLELELNPDVIERIIDLLTDNKTIEDAVDLDNFIDVLQTACALSCSNDKLYDSIINHVVGVIESEYHNTKDETSANNIVTRLGESMVYHRHIETVRYRLMYIVDPYSYIDQIKNTKTYFGDDGYFLVISPEPTWIKKFICSRKFFGQFKTECSVVLPIYLGKTSIPHPTDI